LFVGTSLVGCAGGGGATGKSVALPETKSVVLGAAVSRTARTPIAHVTFVIQENRSVDNLFNGLPGADTVLNGKAPNGRKIDLQPVSLVTGWDLSHSHAAFESDYRRGLMDGFIEAKATCNGPCAPLPPPNPAYSYVPKGETRPYWTMATTYAFADRMFQTNAGPSFPAHEYLISGTAATDSTGTYEAMDNAIAPSGPKVAGCDSPSGTLVQLIDPVTNDQSKFAYPCFDHRTLFDALDESGVGWRYYQQNLGANLWFGPDSISHIRFGPDYANVATPSTAILSDVSSGKLAAVSWVIPTVAESDHPAITDGSGPDWVAQVVNAVGGSQYWTNTAIFVVWDDWGGFYDHVTPQQFNNYELGFRVPLIAISPYARTGYVSHVQHEFGSLLKFTEKNFGTASVGYTDRRADDLSDMFDYAQAPTSFTPIRAALPSARASSDTRSPDTDE